jgi:hypothetical protein
LSPVFAIFFIGGLVSRSKSEPYFGQRHLI